MKEALFLLRYLTKKCGAQGEIRTHRTSASKADDFANLSTRALILLVAMTGFEPARHFADGF